MNVHGLAEEDVQIFLEGIASPLQIRPLVVSDLAFPLNLGHADLCRNQICVDFSMTPTVLKAQGQHAALCSLEKNLLSPSIDVRFRRVQDACREASVPVLRHLLVYCSTHSAKKAQSSVHQVKMTP